MATEARNGPTYPELRRRVAALMLERGEWAGAPVPVEGLALHLEPSYPYQGLSERVPLSGTAPGENPLGLDDNGLRGDEVIVNHWFSRRRSSHVWIVRGADGRTQSFELSEKPYVRRFEIQITGHQAAWAHDIETELVAMQTLAEHVTDEQMRQYMLLGQFLETSKRSKVTYVFRRVRPTIAVRPTLDGLHTRVIAVLCMHPIGYYRGTTVGAMTPTDDVLAHLLLMRGDEKMFWRRCNQHRPEDPEAML